MCVYTTHKYLVIMKRFRKVHTYDKERNMVRVYLHSVTFPRNLLLLNVDAMYL